MNRKLTLFCCLATISITMAGCSTARPLCRSDEKIRASILKRTPVGCSSDRVYALIREEHWPRHDEGPSAGFQKIAPGLSESHSPVVGDSFVACELGVTHFVMFPFETVKYAYWAFDTSGHVIDVWVVEDTDAL
jgi:hypothetical protein